MGIFCSKYDIEGKIRCHKCNDRFKPYGKTTFSQRNSCRVHRYICNGKTTFCIDCKLEKSKICSRNCYHSYY